MSLELPPLRHRVEDIHPLCLRFLYHHSKEIGKDITDLDREAAMLLQRYSYHGNIRELENLIERAVIFCHGKTLTSGDLPRELHDGATTLAIGTTQEDEQTVRVEMILGKQSLSDIESSIIEKVMLLSAHNKTLAAKQLGLTRFALDRRLKKWGVE